MAGVGYSLEPTGVGCYHGLTEHRFEQMETECSHLVDDHIFDPSYTREDAQICVNETKSSHLALSLERLYSFQSTVVGNKNQVSTLKINEMEYKHVIYG